MSKQTVKQQAYRYIKEKIINCEFQPGTFIDEKQRAREKEDTVLQGEGMECVEGRES